LIDDLLGFSRMSRHTIVKSDINTDAMVREVVHELDEVKNIDWKIQPMPGIRGDANTIRQVWINLISNAIKYSRNAGEPHIEIGSFPDNKSVTFFVKDNGVGFDAQYTNKLFKVFQRLHGMEEFEGTGVGLAIVEKIISKHGGKVWAEAEVGKGATFYFNVPSE
jgi:light-regulated signal transduction histidine kinase (bacteriophytochrome)